MCISAYQDNADQRYIVEPAHDKISIRLVRPARTEISLRIRAISSVCTDRRYLQPPGDPKMYEREPMPYGWMYKLIGVFARHTGLTVSFVVRWLICNLEPHQDKGRGFARIKPVCVSPVVFLLTVLRKSPVTSPLFVPRWFHVTFVLWLCVPHLSFCWCLGKFIRRNCGFS